MVDFFYIDIQTPWFYLLIVFAVAWLLQMLFYSLIFSRLAFFKEKPRSEVLPPVSVVICARNEYVNLNQFLEKILKQDYPLFEVVVVNDHSEDDTEFLLQRLSSVYPHLKVVHLHNNVNFFRGKKFPLSVGIKSATYDLLLFTDADCYPVSEGWIRAMAKANPLGQERIVLGYGGYEQLQGFLNKLIRYDTLHTAMQYLGFALSGMPYMGVGRNVMYHRRLFYKAGGFTAHYTLQGGDDDLFINAVAGRKNTSFSVSPESITLSIPKTSFTEWKAQKKRHLSTATSYRFLHKFMLGLYWLSHGVFYLSLPALIIMQYAWVYAIAAYLFRLLLQLWLTKNSMRKLGERNLLLFSPFIDVLYLFLNPYIFLASRIAPVEKWK